MANLEPNIFLRERCRRVLNNVLEALQTQVVLLLLLVDYAEAEVNLVCLLKIWGHAHNLRESLLCVLVGSITVVQDSDTVL